MNESKTYMNSMNQESSKTESSKTQTSRTETSFIFTDKDVMISNSIICNRFVAYEKERGYGFISNISTLPGRNINTDKLRFVPEGVVITETNESVNYENENSYNYGGLAFRIDVDGPGAYEVKVTIADETDEAIIAVSGMNGYRLLDRSTWDAARLIERTNYASWKDKTWSYNLVTGRDYIEIEIEPKLHADELALDFERTVGMQSIEIKQLENNTRLVNDKITIFTLGDSTVKSYIYEEAIMSGWGQVFDDLFDLTKVNVVNYSMGGRSVFNMYHEGRFNEVLMIGKPGDYLLLQSGHNDESVGALTGPEARFGRGNTEATYEQWITQEYITAIRARGIIPVFVTPMTRVNKSEISEEVEFMGFQYSITPGIHFPGILKRIGEQYQIPVLDLYEESMKYLKGVGGFATKAMFLSVEPGETPGKTNTGSYANGNPSGSWDGTHFKETLSKQWARIVVTQMYHKELPASDYLKQEVKDAIESKDWSKVFPEIAKDVITGENAYYREQIECVCKHGIMQLDDAGYFYPKQEITIDEFIIGMKKIWNLKKSADLENKFNQYKVMACNHSDEESNNRYGRQAGTLDNKELSNPLLTREIMAAIILDCYKAEFGVQADGSFYKPKYMTDFNGVNLSPGDPNYDCNLVGESAQYYPLAGFGVMEDKEEISKGLYEIFQTVYELGLMRSEEGLERGVMKNGMRLEPKQVVTREKAAKELYFLRVLKKDIYEETDK